MTGASGLKAQRSWKRRGEALSVELSHVSIERRDSMYGATDVSCFSRDSSAHQRLSRREGVVRETKCAKAFSDLGDRQFRFRFDRLLRRRPLLLFAAPRHAHGNYRLIPKVTTNMVSAATEPVQ